MNGPPYRAEHIGSLLRPASLTAAHSARGPPERSTMPGFGGPRTSASARSSRSRRRVGLRVVTDGEFRRASYWGHFLGPVAGLGDGGGDLPVSRRFRRGGFLSRSAGGRQGAAAREHRRPRVRLPRGRRPCHREGHHALSAHLPLLAGPGHVRPGDLRRSRRVLLRSREGLPGGDRRPCGPWRPLPAARRRAARHAVRPRHPRAPRARRRRRGCAHRPLSSRRSTTPSRAGRRTSWWGSIFAAATTGGSTSRAGATSPSRRGCSTSLPSTRSSWSTTGSGPGDSSRSGSCRRASARSSASSAARRRRSRARPTLPGASTRRRGTSPSIRLGVSPQCGFASTVGGNPITPEIQRRKLGRVVAAARAVWGDEA